MLTGGAALVSVWDQRLIDAIMNRRRHPVALRPPPGRCRRGLRYASAAVFNEDSPSKSTDVSCFKTNGLKNGNCDVVPDGILVVQMQHARVHGRRVFLFHETPRSVGAKCVATKAFLRLTEILGTLSS